MTQPPTMTDEADLERQFEQHVAQLEREAQQDAVLGTDQMYSIGSRDGFESAVQWLDQLTGGDGEYVASTFPERDCRTAAEMGLRIVARLRQAEARNAALEDGLRPFAEAAASVLAGTRNLKADSVAWVYRRDGTTITYGDLRTARHLLASAS